MERARQLAARDRDLHTTQAPLVDLPQADSYGGFVNPAFEPVENMKASEAAEMKLINEQNPSLRNSGRRLAFASDPTESGCSNLVRRDSISDLERLPPLPYLRLPEVDSGCCLSQGVYAPPQYHHIVEPPVIFTSGPPDVDHLPAYHVALEDHTALQGPCRTPGRVRQNPQWIPPK